MIRTLLMTLAVALVAQPVLALSCMQPDIAGTYLRADAADEAYLLVNGRYVRTGQTLPSTDDDGYSFPARFVGMVAGTDGFTQDWAADITVRHSCVDPWCLSMPDDAEVLAFLEMADDGPILYEGMCPGWLTYFQPTFSQFQTVETCVTGGPCEPASGR